MDKEEIKKLLEEAKHKLDENHESFSETIKNDLKTFKKKTLDKI
ncbi:MAG: hypothetical protein ACT4N5_04145 [Nitrosopumilaceae archaeon]